MKKIIYLLGLLALLASTGCVVHEGRGGYHDHGYWEHGHGGDHWDHY